MFRFQNLHDAVAAYREDAPLLAQDAGIIDYTGGQEGHGLAQAYLLEPFKKNFNLAMDAQAQLTTTANAGIPNFLTNWVDPAIYEILFSPNMAAAIFGERKTGDWTTQTAFFPTIEHTGEVSSYGDYSENGSAGANTNFPQRQSYLYQTIVEYGELEMDRAGLAKIGWVSEQNGAAALAMNKYQNLTYFFGVAGLQNYGMLNDPNLTAALAPAPKGNGGNAWITNGVIVATANEIYADIQSLYLQMVNQNVGLIDAKTKMKLCMSPQSAVALTATNSFAVNVEDLIKKNFPGMTVETAMQYGKLSATNPQGLAAGELVQLIIEKIEGQDTGYCAFNEKMRAHPIIRGLSSYKQKQTGGTWGAIIRQAFGISQMQGV